MNAPPQEATTTVSDEAIVEISEGALAKVLEVRSEEPDSETLALRISVSGVSGVEYAYDLAFVSLEEAETTDLCYRAGEMDVRVPLESRDQLAGATLDLPGNAGQGGLVIRNPNRPNPLGDLGDLELSGELADRVTQLLDQRINPALASHGGFASLVGVDDTTVYVTMGGGCQGCAMSQATLTEGIRASILEVIPEVTEVVDATDHSAGENPFYA